MVREHPLLEFAFCKIFDGIFVTVSYYPQPNGPFADKNPNEREAIRSFVCIEIKVLQIVTFFEKKENWREFQLCFVAHLNHYYFRSCNEEVFFLACKFLSF